MILHTENLDIGYIVRGKKKLVLTGLNLGISEGKIIMLIGANGSGKSTLLKSLSGLHSPLSGKIYIGKKETTDFTVRDWSESTSLVLTERPDTGDLDVYSLVALGRIPYTGRTGKLSMNDHHSVENALMLTGLAEYAGRIVMELSDGERQRVMIARAVAQDTPLVILDEPTAFLDAVYRKKLMDWLRKLCSSTGKSFIISTHDLNLVQKYSDAVWLISGNDLEQCPPDKYSENEIIERISVYEK